mmetsp:Transcript_24326/g.55366  ORF Transcript_24326/g.55366 Transcript_24326/m.55366 type:complete len:260 (+) Transcript_24326:439-1218(+)
MVLRLVRHRHNWPLALPDGIRLLPPPSRVHSTQPSRILLLLKREFCRPTQGFTSYAQLASGRRDSAHSMCGRWGAQPSPNPPPPSMLPVCGASAAVGMSSSLWPAASHAPIAPMASQAPAALGASPVLAPAPAPGTTLKGDDTRRLGPRAFKTWVQDPPQPWQGNAAQASQRHQPDGGSVAGVSGLSDLDAERQVDSMVDNLKFRFKQSGVNLPLEKHSGCVYRLGSRKLSLNIRNARLMVRVGGGYCDFLEYLSKATL